MLDVGTTCTARVITKRCVVGAPGDGRWANEDRREERKSVRPVFETGTERICGQQKKARVVGFVSCVRIDSQRQLVREWRCAGAASRSDMESESRAHDDTKTFTHTHTLKHAWQRQQRHQRDRTQTRT